MPRSPRGYRPRRLLGGDDQSTSKTPKSNEEITVKFLRVMLQLNRRLREGIPLTPTEFGTWVWQLVGWVVPQRTTTLSSKGRQRFSTDNPAYGPIIQQLFEQLRGPNWKIFLWAYAAFLNRIQCPFYNSNIKSAFDLVLGMGKTAKDILEMDVIRHHFGIPLELVAPALKSAYRRQIFAAGKKIPVVDWETLVKNITSQTKFEHLYPPEDATQSTALFLVRGNPVRISPKRPDPDVIEVHAKNVFESCMNFVEDCFVCIEKPEMNSRLMRAMILILIDLIDVGLTLNDPRISVDCFVQKYASVEKERTTKHGYKNGKGLVLLWALCGVLSNPSRAEKFKHPEVLKFLKRVEYFAVRLPVHERRIMETQSLRAWLHHISLPNPREDLFPHFLKRFAKFYPRGRGPPVNDLDKQFLNLRVELGFPRPFSLNPNYAKARLCATTKSYCACTESRNDPKCTICGDPNSVANQNPRGQESERHPATTTLLKKNITTPEVVLLSSSPESDNNAILLPPLEVSQDVRLPPILPVFLTYFGELHQDTIKSSILKAQQDYDDITEQSAKIPEPSPPPLSASNSVIFGSPSIPSTVRRLVDKVETSSSSPTKRAKANSDDKTEPQQVLHCYKPSSHFHRDKAPHPCPSHGKQAPRSKTGVVESKIFSGGRDVMDEKWEAPPNSVGTTLPPTFTAEDYADLFFSPRFLTQTMKVADKVWQVIMYHGKTE